MATFTAPDEASMMRLGRSTCKYINAGCVVFLSGEPGAGKTTLVRGILGGFGHRGAVTSPTYTLVEPYHLKQRTIYHFDLYRIKSPVELEMTGIRDMLTESAVILVEWPAHGAGFLPCPDLEVSIQYAGKGRSIDIRYPTHTIDYRPGLNLK